MQASVVFAMVGVPLYVIGALVSGLVGPVEAVPQPEPVRVSFVGDMMFDRYIRSQAERNGYGAIFDDARGVFASTTFAVGNLEGPITTFASVSTPDETVPTHYQFTFASSVAALLANEGFGVVSLSNNHITNFGVAGVVQTTTFLDRAGVQYVGGPQEPYTPSVIATPQGAITVYVYDPQHARDVDMIVKGVEAELDERFVVVYAHWGDEYSAMESQQQTDLAYRFVDAGADLVVGTHPHVIQPKEQYRGVWIYYSLGNFIFDQYFSDDVRCGAVLHVTLDGDTVSYQEDFVELIPDGTTRVSACRSSIHSVGS